MKKNYLLICALGIAFGSFAQNIDLRNSNYSDFNSKFHQISETNNIQKAPFWNDDFSDPSLWTMTDLLNGGTQNWVIGTSAPVGSFSNGMGAISSTTASNGFALYDSDAMATTATNTQDAILSFNNPIDCSAYQYINLNFESYHRKFQDSVFVEISTDNITWDRYEVHQDLGVNDASDNPEFVSVNITATAGGQSAVWFRFRYEGQWDYAWMLDDVSFSETPNNAASISDAVQGGWWVNYSNTGGAGYDYTFKPQSQLANNPYSFEAVLHNDGVAPQNMVLYSEVSDDMGNIVFSSTSNSVLLDMNFPRDTFVCNSTFSPTSLGVYEMRIWGQGDSVMTDTVTLISVITNDVYGRDWAQVGGYWRVGRPCGGMVLATTYDMYADETVYGIQVHIDDASVPGTNIFVALYEDDPNGDPIWLTQSDDYTLTSNDLDTWVTIPIDGGWPIFNGNNYYAAVGGYANPIDTFQVNVSGDAEAVSCWIQDNGCNIGSNGFASWYWISDIPMIRMSFDASVLNNNKIDSKQFNVYPNPSNGLFNLEINDIYSDDFSIKVVNVLGELVYKNNQDINILNTNKIDLSHLKKGVYMIELNSSSYIQSQQIIIE
tara:strand:+ start:13232 stop:15040 length:1809 start_codon:yes stop_codon:yes gene_type:complete